MTTDLTKEEAQLIADYCCDPMLKSWGFAETASPPAKQQLATLLSDDNAVRDYHQSRLDARGITDIDLSAYTAAELRRMVAIAEVTGAGKPHRRSLPAAEQLGLTVQDVVVGEGGQ